MHENLIGLPPFSCNYHDSLTSDIILAKLLTKLLTMYLFNIHLCNMANDRMPDQIKRQYMMADSQSYLQTYDLSGLLVLVK